MSEYTPTTEHVRQNYIDYQYLKYADNNESPPPTLERFAEFGRWLAQEHRDAHAAAIRDAATELLALDPVGDAVMWDGKGYERVYDWLLDRAKQEGGEA